MEEGEGVRYIERVGWFLVEELPKTMRELMADVLRMDHINSLPQPFMVRFCGDKDWSNVIDIGVDVPIVRFDACGVPDYRRFSEVMEIKDALGDLHDPDDWYLEAE